MSWFRKRKRKSMDEQYPVSAVFKTILEILDWKMAMAVQKMLNERRGKR